MDKFIARAIESINKLLEWSSDDSKLVETCNLLNRLLESDSSRNEWTQLFCRQLNRLMDYNESLSEQFWITSYDDILFIIEGLNGKQGIGRSWNRFHKRIIFEKQLKQREIIFQQTFGEHKTLNELFCEHKQFFEEYLHQCISLHSKVQVQGLLENINGFLREIYEVTQTSIILKSRKRLGEKLKSIEINLDCSNRSLQSLHNRFSNNVNNSLSTFLPSIERTEICRSNICEKMMHVLQRNRWIVILGDPGSAKTTLLRWITRIFAETAQNGHEEGGDPISVRIPILIRIGEFATWFNQHQTKTLIDYIGEHTWFSEHYCHMDYKYAVRQLIDNGHALILLDGLDEIHEVRQRGEIIDLVKKFIHQYIVAPDFYAAVDEKIFNDISSYYYGKVIETQPPNKPGGNQIIITSRIVGYQLYPLIGPFMEHYGLLLMDHKEAKEFVNEWMAEVEKGISDFLLQEEIKIDEQVVEIAMKKRSNAVKSMFENGSELLISNPSLLSLICTFIFQSADEFHPKSRLEVYYHAVQAALRSWKSRQSNISEDMLTKFLIELGIYLHLNSPSGLIDEFDMKNLCCLILQQLGLSNDRTKLREYAKELISLLDFNIGIFAERGLQIFGFLHLSFQEYFVAQSFVKGSPDEFAKRILTFTVNSRFRESLLLALSWISWKWSFDDYDKFCYLLVTSTRDYSIPFGILLLFDAFNDVQRLPSDSVIFVALNNLLDHPSYSIRRRYFISNLSKLHENIIEKWMQLHLEDDKYLFKFCQSFPRQDEEYFDINWTRRNSISSVVCRQLWSFHHRSSSAEFLIDQTLRIAMQSMNLSDQTFNKDFNLYFLSNDICISEVHPLIISVIISVCGRIRLKVDEKILKIDFSTKQMHRESSILASIIEYFANKKESHQVKIPRLVQQYESFIQKCSPSDTSVDIVDTFIALICLQGVSQPLIYEKYDRYQALLMALDRLKRTWFYFKKSCDSFIYIYGTHFDISAIKYEVESIMNVFFSQSDPFNKQQISFSIACATAWKKLGIWDPTRALIPNIHRDGKVELYYLYQPAFIHLTNEENIKNIHSTQMLQQQLFFLLNFLPQSLQELYLYTIIAPINKIDLLPLVVLLSRCLIHLEDGDKLDLYFCLALPMLYPLLKEHMLENYALVLFREKYYRTEFPDRDCEELLKAMKDRNLLDPFLIDQPIDWEILINVERQRIHRYKDLRLFASSISLARLFQGQHRSRSYYSMEIIKIDDMKSKEVHTTIINIVDPLLRIIAFNIVLNMKDPLIFYEEQRDELRCKMINILHSLVPNLPLLTATLLFVRCYSSRQFYPLHFQEMSNKITEKFNDEHIQSQRIAFIALRQLNNPDLSHYLSEFAKRTDNLSDLLRFNSRIFHNYFTHRTSFDSSNTLLLSSMYLIELAFDTQILKMYVRDDHKNDILPLKELSQLWNDSSKDKKIMTYKVATWITINLKILNKEDLHQIVKDVSQCSLIEMKALLVIEKWLDYRIDKDFQFFAHYAALQLIIGGSDIPSLIDIINEMVFIDTQFRLKSLIEHLINSRLINSTVVRQILITIHKNVRYSSRLNGQISSKEMLELILNLELERITSDQRGLSKISTKPFLSMIAGLSLDLQIYLVNHLRIQSELEIDIEEEYLCVVLKWFIMSSTENTNGNVSIESYKYILTLLNDQRYPRVKKSIINALNSVYIHSDTCIENIYLQDDIIIHLEKLIHSWNTYSKDILAVCLLAYGNCLLKLIEYRTIENISDETKNALTILSEISTSEVISIRATFVLIFSVNSNITCLTISNWYRNKSNMTSETRYKILLQQTLYNMKDSLCSSYVGESENKKEIIDYLETHCSELMDTFVIDLYNYLCNENNCNYLSDPIPDCVEIALEISRRKMNEFRNAVKKSSFGENDFKRELYLCCKTYSRNLEPLIHLYTVFGVLTNELIEMIEWCEYVWFDTDSFYLKEVSDRDVIDKIFKILDSKTYDNKFQIYLLILKYLARNHAISLLELHQRISLINYVLYDNDKEWQIDQCICDLLLKVSCFEQESLYEVPKRLLTRIDIDGEFEREIADLDKMSPVFVKRNNL